MILAEIEKVLWRVIVGFFSETGPVGFTGREGGRVGGSL